MFMSKLDQIVDQGSAFFLQNGKVLNSVRELYDEIHSMPEAVYFHHVPNLIGNNAYYFHDDSIARPYTWSGKSKKVKIDNLIFY